jgi:CubicO group peptidase (beta-lactamase class C family)
MICVLLVTQTAALADAGGPAKRCSEGVGGTVGLLSDGAIEQLEAQIATSLGALERFTVLGSVLSVALPCQAPITVSNGFANAERNEPVTAKHRFQIGSQTKMFTAAAILLLQKQSELDIDDPVSDYVSGVPRAATLTIRQLLQHTGGIGDSITFFDPPAGQRPDFEVSFEQHLFLGRVAGEQFVPGEKWFYNNLGFVVLGHVVEAASGQPLNVYIREKILQPLGMRDTYLGNLEQYPEDKMARGYFLQEKTGNVIDTTAPDLSWASSAGDMVSSIADMRRWARALLDEDNVVGISLEDFTRDAVAVSDFGNLEHYGFGMMQRNVAGQVLWGHGGFIHGYVTLTLVEPSSGIVVQLMTNLSDESEQIIAALETTLAIALNLAQFASHIELR